MTTLGIYGGSFDPIHKGHMSVANKLIGAGIVDDILFVPAALSPHKRDDVRASAMDRLRMIQCAIDGVLHMDVSDVELRRGGVSYTVDTVTFFAANEALSPSPRTLRFIIGGDAAETFHTWKDPEKIVAQASPIVVKRAQEYLEIPESPFRDALISGITDIVVDDISSTEVRRRIQSGESCDDIVDVNVLKYIYTNNLYRK